MENFRLQQLIEGLVNHRLTPQEKEELDNILLVTDPPEITLQVIDLIADEPVPPFDESLLPIAYKAIAIDKRRPVFVRRIHFLKSLWFRYAAAILLLCGVGAYFWNNNPRRERLKTVTQHAIENNILPGTNKAILVLGDESILNLDSLPAGQSITQGNVQVIKSADGELLYIPLNKPGSNKNAVFINTMKTPRGGQYQLTLPDGSQAWLNAESSITYPTTFTENERHVTITGEVYFDIAKNASKPFTVRTPNENITVLGTSFNVNSYTDESSSKTTLVDGKLKIENIVLYPGQAYASGKVQPTNIQQDIAWKNGEFDFSGATVPIVMRQLARWYDVTIIYENNRPPLLKLQGSMSRDLPLNSVLKGLAVIGVRCRLEKDRRLVVLSD